ncbi:MAG: polysaccharide deacetylase family protein [Acidobacteriota bacterium]
MQRRKFLGALAGLTAALGTGLAPGAITAPSAQAAEPRLPKGMMTFTFDDGIVTNYTKAFPILRKRNQLATVGIVASRVTSGNNDYMDISQVRELEQAGWEVASHSLTHTRPISIPRTYAQERIPRWHLDGKRPEHYQAQYEFDLVSGIYQDEMPLVPVESSEQVDATKGSYWYDRTIAELHVRPYRALPPETLDIRVGSYQRELEQSRRILREAGFNVDTFIAPYNYWTDDVKAMSVDYYARACTGRDSDNRPATFDPYAIKRFMVHEHDTVQSLSHIIRDHCLQYGGWVVLCFHGVGESLGWEPYSPENLDALCQWINSEGIPVVTVREGTRIMQELQRKNGQHIKTVSKKES